MHTAPYFTALGLIAIYLSARIVGFRRGYRVSLGDGDVVLLRHARAGFANFMEYTPFALVLILALEFMQAPVWYLHLCGGTLLIGRMIHAVSFMRDPIPLPPRSVGMILTWLSLLLGAIGVTVFSLIELQHG